MLTTNLIENILATIPHRTIGVLGDLFLDRYLDIDAALNEPSIETGLTAYQVVRVRSYPGALGTIINNLAALGVGTIYPIACIGDDGEGYELQQALRATPGVGLGGIVAVGSRRTPTYTKPMLMATGEAPRELNRLDIKNRTPTTKEVEDRIIDLLDEVWPQLDAVIVLDQVSEEDCGVVTGRVRERIALLGERDPDKFVLADSRERIGLFRNVCVKPNRSELMRAITNGRDLASLTRRPVFCTHGEEGIEVAWPPALPQEPLAARTFAVAAYPVSGPIDIVGAGDSCSAGIAAAMVSGASHEQAAAFGNLIASITIQQIGVTGTASPSQIRERWREVSG